MAGHANNRARIQALEAENEQLKRELTKYRLTGAPKRQRIVSREYDDTVIDELIDWSEQGLFIDECLAQWGISAETFQEWVRSHDSLRLSLGPARARAKAAMLRTLRDALKNRTAFPVSLADRIIAMIDKENEQAGADDASRLVLLDLTSDAQSAANAAQVTDNAADRATNSESHGT